MGKKLKRREAQRQEAERAVCAVLETHSKCAARPLAIERYDDFKPAYRAKVEALQKLALRRLGDWRCSIKSRSEDKRFIDLVRFSFARYRVAAHLENAWLDECGNLFVNQVTPLQAPHSGSERNTTMLHWHLVAAQGGSLYKQYASAYLSKVETHHFLNVSKQVTTSRQALWYAVVRAQTDRGDIACQLSHTNLQDYSVASTWWKEVARFFAREQLARHEIHDLIDFLRVAKLEDPSFSLRGRSLASLRRRMEDWHRELRKNNMIGGGVWPGAPIRDVDYEAGSDDQKAIWHFRQIKTGNELFREGQRMHHCVASYKSLCMNGHISIWSLTSEFPIGHANRGVTMEVRKDGTIVQCRGFANRLPYGNEVAMVKRWAQDYGLRWTGN
jgi:hypothetical protein